MAKYKCKPAFGREQQVQDWLESVIRDDRLVDVIKGKEHVVNSLRESDSSEFWPSFPIDYLTRLGNLRAAERVLASLCGLELVSKSNRSISREKGERLFADLLYCTREGSHFVIFEIKNQDASAREAITELIAYEHEVLNHTPFCGSNDIMMVIVSRNFSTLLDHAITGLNTWSRRHVLCLQFDDSGDDPCLVVHIPKAWSAIGQKGLAASGLVTATLSFKPSPELDENDIYAIYSTAAGLMVREAERSGGSGFAIVAYNHFYPGLAEAPYLILAGAVNPFSFLELARDEGLLENSSSPISDYILEDERVGDLAVSWDWLSCDGGAAVEYLRGYGTPHWETFSNWRDIRDIRRWRCIAMDRHVTPISADFWGVLGDYARDAVRHTKRMRNFMPSLAKPGIDWRHPTLGVILLDEIALEPPLIDGQWTFSALFTLGLRLGRFAAIFAQIADADPEQQRLLTAAAFWAEIDILGMLHEIRLRYLSAKEITEPPPQISVDKCKSGEEVMASVSAFADWFGRDFIGEGLELMYAAFVTGRRVYVIFDPQFDHRGDDPEFAALREEAVSRAREWLKWSVVVAIGEYRDASAAAKAIGETFGNLIPLNSGKESALAAIDGLSPALLIEKLLIDIPKIVDNWHPQLAHTLAPMAASDHDWDWYEDQIRAARARGEKYPCVIISAGGQLSVGRIPPQHLVPDVDDVAREVLLVNNESRFEVILVVTWEDLRAGNVPGLRKRNGIA